MRAEGAAASTAAAAAAPRQDDDGDDDENQPLVPRSQASDGGGGGGSKPVPGADASSAAGAAGRRADSEDGGVGSLVAAMVITVALVPFPAVVSAAYGVPAAAGRTGAVALLMAAYWSLEPLPLAVTALLPVVLLPVMGVLPASHVAVQYMNNSNLLFLGSLFVAAAVEQAGLHYRLALGVLRIVGTQPHKLLLGFMGACGFLSMFISNSATAACMLPIARKLLQTLGQHHGGPDGTKRAKHFGKGLLLGVAYSCSLGGMASLTGTGTNIAFAGFWTATYGPGGGGLTFGRWLLFALPLSVVLILVVWLVLCARFVGLGAIARQQQGQANAVAVIEAEAEALGPMSTREKIVLVHFVGQALLWLTREMGGDYGWGKLLFEDGYVSDATIAMTTAMSLFMMPAGSAAADESTRPPDTIYAEGSAGDGDAEELPVLRQTQTPTADSGQSEASLEPEPEPEPESRGSAQVAAAGGGSEAAEVKRCLDRSAVKTVDWGVVLLLGGGFALADAFGESGLSAYLGEHVMAPLAELPLGVVTVGVCSVMTLMTEFTSNVATVSVALPLLAAAAERMGVAPALLLVPATCATSCAFMLPVATPPNAVVFAGGGLAVRDMLFSGFVANVLALAIICLYTPLMAPVAFGV